MSTQTTPQSIQKMLDQNAQLIKVLVENMNMKGKAMECIQIQQSLHKNLVYLATLADPSLDVQNALPHPGSYQRQQQQQQHQAQQQGQRGQTPPSTTSTTGPSQQQQQQQSEPAATAAGGGVSSHMTSASGGSSGGGSQQQQQRQPQANSNTSSGGPTLPSDVQSMRRTPPGSQFPGPAGSRAMWSGQGDPYGMQRSGMAGSGYQMGMSPEQQLRLRQEQMIQVQQARRMQQAAAVAAGAGMYPPPPPPPPGAGGPPPGMMPPPQSGLPPPGYPPSTMNPHSMPPGNRQMKM